MKKLFASIAILFCLLAAVMPTAYAAKDLNTAKQFFDNSVNSNVPGGDPRIQGVNPYQEIYKQYVAPFLNEENGGEVAISRVIFRVIDIFRYVISAVAVIFVVMAGVKLVTQGEEQGKKQLDVIRDIVVGIVTMNIAGEVVTRVFGNVGEKEDIATRSTAEFLAKFQGEQAAKAVPFEFSNEVIFPLMQFFLAFLAAFSILFLIISAFRIITSQGDPAKVAEAQKLVMNTGIGLGVILMANVFVQSVYGIPMGDINGPTDLTPDLGLGIVTAMTVINYLLSSMALACLVSFIYAGVLIFTARENDSQRKKGMTVVKFTFIALIVAMSSYTIISALIRIAV